MNTIKQLPVWVCWNTVEVGDRVTKVPCAAKGGATGTSRDYTHTWVTYDEAVAAMRRHGNTGVGFIIPEGVFFIDRDHIDPNDPSMQTLLERFPSYAERSYSDSGVHVYARCDLSRLPVSHARYDRGDASQASLRTRQEYLG